MRCKKVDTKNGQVWECVADAPNDPVTGKRKQIRRRAKTQKEAKSKVEKAIRSLQDDQIDENISKRITFDQAAKHWLHIYRISGVKESTVMVREREIRTLNKHIAKVPIGQITHLRYQKLINKLAPNYARITLQGINNCANMIFKQAIKDKLIKENPALHVTIPKKTQTIEDIETDEIAHKYLERDELEDFFTTVQLMGLENDFEMFNLLAFTGMRSGELLVLKWSDINFETNEISITKTLFNPSGNSKKYKLTPPKTKGSIRKVTVEDEVLSLLKSLQRRQRKFNMKYRSEIEDFHDADFVFAKKNGYPYNLHFLLSRMNRLIKFTDIKKHATPHIFRHTHISMMAEAGIDLPTIMDRVGHEDINTTNKIYTHVTKKMKQDASDKVRNVYKNLLDNMVSE
ncbi:tyrosine-type recombinase/integrase [Gracilibacillus sp. D59]|uniref:tyrosine-type recombinase/integrase n=1 Tax=Gracilibacillus sp. D59 TaxID=3457434 RepID=UPI003FCDABFF